MNCYPVEYHQQLSRLRLLAPWESIKADQILFSVLNEWLETLETLQKDGNYLPKFHRGNTFFDNLDLRFYSVVLSNMFHAKGDPHPKKPSFGVSGKIGRSPTRAGCWSKGG
jgi:hypothetical protein